MRNLAYLLIALSGLGFVLAVLTAPMHYSFMGVAPEGFSRAANNLALLAIALLLAESRSLPESPRD